MTRWRSVAVGSVPAPFSDSPAPSDSDDALRAYFDDVQTDVVTRLEVVVDACSPRPDEEPPFIRSWRALASVAPNDGHRFSDWIEPSQVKKAQLAGPVTLLAGGYAPLHDTFRRTRAAIDALLAQHSALEEVWFDEPAMQRDDLEQFPLFEKCLNALRHEFFDLRFGVHLCNNAPWERVFAIDGLRHIHFDADRYRDAFLEASHRYVAGDRPVSIDVVAGVVPTRGPVEAPATLAERVASFAEDLPAGFSCSRLSTSCGLAGLSMDDARARMRAVRATVDHLNGAVGA